MNWNRLIPSLRICFLLLCYSAVLVISHFFSYQLRFDFNVPPDWSGQFWEHWTGVLALKLVLLLLFGQFSGLLSYFSLPDLRRLFTATVAASLILLLMRYQFQPYYLAPRAVG